MDIENGVRVARRVILGTIVVVCVGYLLLSVAIPTDAYRQKWKQKIRYSTYSTYFGVQGAYILIFTFPMLLVAVLGSVYLHLCRINISDNAPSDTKKLEKFATLRRPMIVKGLGIITRIELFMFLMFLVFMCWSFYGLHVNFSRTSTSLASKYGMKIWEAKLAAIALRLGFVGNTFLVFLFYPVTRGSSVVPLLGLTWRSSVKYHVWLGNIVMTLFTAHGLLHIIVWASTNRLWKMVSWERKGVPIIAGELALLSGLVIWATSLPSVRRRKFEYFYYTHQLYPAFFSFFLFHVGVTYMWMMLPGFYLFIVDRFLRFLQSRNGARLLSARVLPSDTLELTFSKTQGLSYNPTCFIFINVPRISKLQWHPFFISSSSGLETDRLSIITNGQGSWTTRLYELISTPNPIEHIYISTEGPYGPASVDLLRYDELLLVSGGSGITPLISIIRELIFINQSQNLSTPRVTLITAFKSSSDLSLLELLLPLSTDASHLSPLDLHIDAYITREQEPISQNESPFVTKIFQPNPNDKPISSILGSNFGLWLAIIISFSFMLFILLLGLMTRFIIYPVDHNTFMEFPNSAKTVLSSLLICISIPITASGVFYLKKMGTDTGVEETHVAADEELEPLPQVLISESATVHYGARPNLEGILANYKESSVGVFVCGPKTLRHEVARICASGADNLHFESISFS